MAIFYKHIKGCGTSTTGVSASTTDLWTYLVWRDTGDKVNNVAIGAPKSAHFNYAPSIKVSASQSGTQYDLGKIITSEATEQYINKAFTFKDNVVAKTKVETPIIQSPYSGTSRIEFTCSDILQFWLNNLTCVSIDSDEVLIGGIKLTANGNAKLKKNLHVGTSSHSWENTDIGIIKADSKCEALYFNATSDRRAKSNIIPLSASALSIVKSLPIYTFNYTSKPEETTIGLIAQEAAEHDLDSFNMVDNLDASGENNDFMQMKESKLVYVLWKAIQELSEEVESLKAQLNNK